MSFRPTWRNLILVKIKDGNTVHFVTSLMGELYFLICYQAISGHFDQRGEISSAYFNSYRLLHSTAFQSK